MRPAPISFTVRLTLGDLYRAQLWALINGSRAIWGVLAILLLLTINTLRWNSQQGQGPTSNLGPLLQVLVVWIVILLVVPIVVLRMRLKGQKSLHEETHYTISMDKIDMQSATASSQIGWPRILRVAETKSYFYLCETKLPTFILPKRNLADATRIADLREIIRESAKGKVQLLS